MAFSVCMNVLLDLCGADTLVRGPVQLQVYVISNTARGLAFRRHCPPRKEDSRQGLTRKADSRFVISFRFVEVSMAESRGSKWAVLSFLIGTALGSGSLWQWKQSKREAQKQELETIVKTTNLRQQENDQYAKIIDLTNEYIKARDQYSKNPDPELNNRIPQLKSQLDVMKDNFMALEDKLAHLEARQPRKIAVDFIPPEPPTNLRAVVH